MIREAASGRPQRPPALVALVLVAFAILSVPAQGDSESLPERLPAAVADAQKLVERIRGVPFPGTIASAVLPEKELPRVLEKKLAEDLPVSFERYSASLVALGLVPPEKDLKRRMLKLYARQVAAFYDPDEKKFFVVPERSDEAASTAAGFGAGAEGLLEQALLAHELTHALQDRRLDLVPRMAALRENSDASLALQAFLEGEATVVMMEAILARLPEEARAATSTDQLLASMAQIAARGIEGAEGVPEYFVKELLFPYTAGTAWISERRSHGGWMVVDATYDHPPETTAEILDPSRTGSPRMLLPFSHMPSSEDLPSKALPLYVDRLGAFVLRSLLEAAGAADAGTLSLAWQDDRILFYERSGATGGPVGFVWRLRLASAGAARRIAALLAAFYEARAPGASAVRAEGDVVRVTRRAAPAARRLAPALPALTSPAEASVPPARR
ncbi:MAG: hypothetical protein ACHQPI_11185 [Thermoanaerobaculia bacterium]